MLNELRDEIHQWAIDKGWENHEKYPQRSVGDYIALMHSELSEALEDFRAGHGYTEVWFQCKTCRRNCPEGIHPVDMLVCARPDIEPRGIPIEMADCIIRILQFGCVFNIDIDEAMRLKMEYNKTRPERHGNRVI